MRYDVKKFLFIGIEEERVAFFKQAQEAGIVHFIDSKVASKEVPAEINNFTAAIKILRGLPTMHQEDLIEFALADGLVHKIISIHHQLEKLAEELRVVRLEIERVAIFGDFSIEDIEYIEKEGKRKIQFFFARHGIGVEKTLPDEVLYVGTDHNLDYFVAINKVSAQYDRLTEMRIEHPVGQLRKHQKMLQKEFQEAELQLKGYAKYNTFLHHALVNKLNAYNLHAAQNTVALEMDDSLFAVEAWVPVNKITELHQLVKELDVHVEEVAIEPTEVIPTYLENKGAHRVGEDLVHIYDTPSITDKDPSLWVLVAFSLFFAFIVGDGGYGLVFLSVALYLRYKFPTMGGTKKRVWKLLTILAVACIGWGLLTNSFFGITFAPDSPFRKVSVINWLVEKKTAYHIAHKDDTYTYWVKKIPQLQSVTDPKEFMQKAVKVTDGQVSYELVNKFSDNIMMELALFIGSIHVILSMLRYLNRNWVFLGWIVFIIGGYLYIPHYLHATSLIHFAFGLDPVKSAAIGVYLIAGGVAFAVVASLIKNKLAGLTEVMTSIQIFSDIMSYLRLYALGLAGAMVTGVINDTASNINIVLAIILIVLAHAINILLSVMGGVIHGLRLNFLEWYHYSFEGGGKMFKPLHKMKIE